MAEPARFVLGGGPARDDGFGDVGIVAVEVRVAGHVGFLADLERGDTGAVPGDQGLQERAVPGDVAAP